MATEPEIVPIASGDLDRVAEVHLAAFPSAALSLLGHEAVRRYYDWQLNGPHDVVARAARVDGRILGFCFGGVFRGAMAGFLRTNRAYLIWRMVSHPWLLGHPLVRKRLASRIRLGLSRPRAAASPAPASGAGPRPFGILAIAVDPASQKLGLGSLLMKACEDVARQRGFDRMQLGVHPDNDQAIRFYRRLGWVHKEGGDSWVSLMSKDLGQAVAGDLPRPDRPIAATGEEPRWRT